MRRALLLVLLSALPLAQAVPISYDPDTNTYTGAATQNSRDDQAEWQTPVRICLLAFTWNTYTLTVTAASPFDELRVEAEDVNGTLSSATATLGYPATLSVHQKSSCDDFTVVGVDVEGTALYELQGS